MKTLSRIALAVLSAAATFLVSLVALTERLAPYIWPSLLVSVPASLLVAAVVWVAVAVTLRRRGGDVGEKRAESGVSRRY